MLNFLKKLLLKRREPTREETLKSIRREFLFWGYDLSDLSDDELERRIVEGQKRISQMGLTKEELLRACQAMARLDNTAAISLPGKNQ